MKKGSLQSKKQSLEAKQRKNSTHMRGRARICVLLEDLSTPRQLWPCLGIAPWKSTHMHGKPTAHIPESPQDKPKRNKHFHKPHSSTHRRTRPTHMRGRHLGSKQPHMTHA
ncbi:hypothetical protein PIB30_075532 [Stylosanthes scabra]|uniref:Uncharacterized protein n=1 Tax=Stylosanthes scabra TaxID=79078 RepID=A0ABU6SRX3_9FABA|nr:hypothetical protein [Stylosanthes scabra]